MNLFIDLQDSITKNSERDAFFINGIFFKYSDLALSISKIRKSIRNNTEESQKYFGLILNDDIETYAGIIALWLEGKAYVPINPETPRDRNENIINQADLKTIIDSSDHAVFPLHNLILSKNLPDATIDLNPKYTSEQESVYLLFTSGTTGQPKGVPISRENITGFVLAFWEMGFEVDENDRFLQMFDLTFDLSVMSYLIPLLKGACIYTIPKNKIKFGYVFELLEEQKLTFALMVPSILQYLRQYFDEMDFPDLKYSLFCGEALPLDVTEEWTKCLPKAKIYNVYGPTENTIFCTYYGISRKLKNKSHNGVLSIGQEMPGTKTIIIDDKNKSLPVGNIGELCLSGIQLTPGYWKNEKINKSAFFYAEYKGKKERFYKTGDLCERDKDGDIMYIGRLDFQTQIQGFRVELSEIEFHAKSFLEKINVVAVTYADPIGNSEIGLIIESDEFDKSLLHNFMKAKMPLYMLPKRIKFIYKFPLNSNGKTDRSKLKSLFDKPRK